MTCNRMARTQWRPFRFASHGIPKPATTKTTIPTRVRWGSRHLRRDNPALPVTKMARTKTKAPAARAASFSVPAEFGLERNRQRTTIAERSSTALSPPNPKRAGLCAFQAAASATKGFHSHPVVVQSENPCHKLFSYSPSGQGAAAVCNAASDLRAGLGRYLERGIR